MERLGGPSFPAVLMFGPRSTGGPQGASVLGRFESQMLAPPRPPRRASGGRGRGDEVQDRLRPSLAIAGMVSVYDELIAEPRLTGGHHGRYAGESSAATSAARGFAPPGPTRCLSDAHASATATSTQSSAILSIGFIGLLPTVYCRDLHQPVPSSLTQSVSAGLVTHL